MDLTDIPHIKDMRQTTPNNFAIKFKLLHSNTRNKNILFERAEYLLKIFYKLYKSRRMVYYRV